MSLFHSVQTDAQTGSAFYLMGSGACFLEVKRPACRVATLLHLVPASLSLQPSQAMRRHALFTVLGTLKKVFMKHVEIFTQSMFLCHPDIN